MRYMIHMIRILSQNKMMFSAAQYIRSFRADKLGDSYKKL